MNSLFEEFLSELDALQAEANAAESEAAAKAAAVNGGEN